MCYYNMQTEKEPVWIKFDRKAAMRIKKVTIDGKDYKIDLLFFHRELRRLVVVELKIGEFETEYKAQVELYLRWLNKYERMENEESPVALILCAEKSDKVIELLELDKGDIRVS